MANLFCGQSEQSKWKPQPCRRVHSGQGDRENKLKQQTVVHGEGKGSVGGCEEEGTQADEVHLCTSPGRET